MANQPDLMKIVEDQLKSNPQELKKLKKKMRKWGKSPDGQQKIAKMMQTMSGIVPPVQSEETPDPEPRDVLRARIKSMKDKRIGRS